MSNLNEDEDDYYKISIFSKQGKTTPCEHYSTLQRLSKVHQS